jgi:cysteine-S-conjugate beta-lyase
MTISFDEVVDRRHSDSCKWREYDADVLPLWVADMDFPAPEAVVRALRRRVEHGVFGYGEEPRRLREAIIGHLAHRFRWEVAPSALVLLPGVVTAVNLACRAFGTPGAGVLVQPPVYPPILEAPLNAGMQRVDAPLTADASGRYAPDPAAFTEAITPQTRLFLLCSPHNPVGRVFTRDELAKMAESCLQRGVLICSDDIHCDLLLGGMAHTPIAALDAEIAKRTITLMAPSKTYNIAGLGFAVAVIPDPALRAAFLAAGRGLVPGVNLMGMVAAQAAYEEGAAWLGECLEYLRGNRDYVLDFVRSRMPGVRLFPPEGTHLAWLDCRLAGLPGNAQAFFLKSARVALNDGASFGPGGEGFVRLNFACPRATLAAALERMAQAMLHHSQGEEIRQQSAA